MTPLLEVRDGGKVVRLADRTPLTLLAGVDLTVARGQSLAIVGPSGSGKTTLLGVLGLMDRLSTGSYHVCGADTARLDDGAMSSLRAKTFGFVFQRFVLMSHLTAAENVESALLHARWGGRRARRRQVEETLGLVGLTKRAGHRPEQLSGGEQQRVAIARAIATQPQVVLADEPTGSLDQATGETVIDLLLSAVEAQGTTLVLVTHNPDLADRLDRMVRLDTGALVSAR